MPICSDKIKAGTKVRIKKCLARVHGNNNGCICHLIDKIAVITKRYWTVSDGPPQYQIKGHNQRVTRAEVVILRNQNEM